MKKFLLCAAFAATMFSMSAQEATLQLLWKNPAVPAAAECRQIVVNNGKIYAQIKGEKRVVVYDENGATDEVYETAEATGITKDEAGNIIVRGIKEGEVWHTNGISQLLVIPADGGDVVAIDVEGPVGRNDFLGLVKGNILEGEATMYLMGNGETQVQTINFVDGEQDLDNSWPGLVNPEFTANGQTYISYFAGVNDEYLIVNQRSQPIMNLIPNGDNFDAENLVTPDRINTGGVGVNNGISPFSLNGEDFILYNVTAPGSSNYVDGWSIAKISTEADNEPVVSCTEGLANAVAGGGYQSSWLFAQPTDVENVAHIFVYHPSYYFACYEFTYGEAETGVSTVNAEKTVAGVQYVNVAGQVSNVPFDGVNMVVTSYTDGSKSTVKVIK